MKILFLIPCRGLIPSGQVRVINYLPELRREGIDASIIDYYHPTGLLRSFAEARHKAEQSIKSYLNFWFRRVTHRLFNDRYQQSLEQRILVQANSVDAVFVQWVCLNRTTLETLARRGCPVIYDFDDALYLSNPQGFKNMLEYSWCVVAGSTEGFEVASKQHRKVVHVPSTVDLSKFQPHPKPRQVETRPVTIGWIGGPSTAKYLHLIAEPVRRLVDRGIALRLLFAGTGYSDCPQNFGPVPVNFIHQYSDTDIPEITRKIDVGIMPLPDTAWARGKCAMKFLIYGAANLPCIASGVGEIRQIARHGVDVLLAFSEEEWTLHLGQLIDSSEMRIRVGAAAYDLVSRKFSIKSGYELLRNRVFAELPGAKGAG